MLWRERKVLEGFCVRTGGGQGEVMEGDFRSEGAISGGGRGVGKGGTIAFDR